MSEVLLGAHFTVVVVPFRHAGARGDAWKPWWTRLSDDDAAIVLEEAAFFVPYIAAMLVPESTVVRDERLATVRERKSLDAYRAATPETAVLRLTTKASKEIALARRDREPVRLRVDWVDALLFPTGVGFLVVKLALAAESPTLEDLVAANAQLRQLRAPSPTWVLATLKDGERETSVREWFVSRLGDLGELDPVDRAQLFTYACASRIDEEAAAGAFPTAHDRLLFEFATCIPVGGTLADPAWVPGPDQIEGLVEDNRFAPWNAWRALSLKDAWATLGKETIPFTQRALPRILETSYLPLYLYALHQRTMLARFADVLVQKVSEGAWDLRAIRRHTEAFSEFRHRYWIGEVTRRPLSGELFRKMQHGLEVHPMFEAASRAAGDVKAFYEERRARQITMLLQAMSFAFGPFGVSAGVANLALPSDASRALRAVVVLGLVAMIWTGLAIAFRIAGRPASGSSVTSR